MLEMDSFLKEELSPHAPVFDCSTSDDSSLSSCYNTNTPLSTNDKTVLFCDSSANDGRVNQNQYKSHTCSSTSVPVSSTLAMDTVSSGFNCNSDGESARFSSASSDNEDNGLAGLTSSNSSSSASSPAPALVPNRMPNASSKPFVTIIDQDQSFLVPDMLASVPISLQQQQQQQQQNQRETQDFSLEMDSEPCDGPTMDDWQMVDNDCSTLIPLDDFLANQSEQQPQMVFQTASGAVTMPSQTITIINTLGNNESGRNQLDTGIYHLTNGNANACPIAPSTAELLKSNILSKFPPGSVNFRLVNASSLPSGTKFTLASSHGSLSTPSSSSASNLTPPTSPEEAVRLVRPVSSDLSGKNNVSIGHQQSSQTPQRRVITVHAVQQHQLGTSVSGKALSSIPLHGNMVTLPTLSDQVNSLASSPQIIHQQRSPAKLVSSNSPISIVSKCRVVEKKGGEANKALPLNRVCDSSPTIIAPSSTTISADGKRRIHKCLFNGCKKIYTKSSHLKAHQRTHTGSSFACIVPFV